MQNRRLLTARRALFKASNADINHPTPYYPTVQEDEIVNAKTAFAARTITHQRQLSESISQGQKTANKTGNVVRCRTQAYSVKLPTASLQPVLVLQQNLERVFLVIAAAVNNVGAIGVSFNNPGTRPSLQFPAMILLPGTNLIFNSSVIPIDDIYIEGPNAGDFATAYEGISIGGLIS